MPKVKKIFTEYGLDFDNNRFGFGRSTEIEYADGSEMRTHERIKINKIHARYFRIWIGKIVFVIDSDKPHFSIRKKKRWNFKIVYGKSGLAFRVSQSVLWVINGLLYICSPHVQNSVFF